MNVASAIVCLIGRKSCQLYYETRSLRKEIYITLNSSINPVYLLHHSEVLEVVVYIVLALKNV